MSRIDGLSLSMGPRPPGENPPRIGSYALAIVGTVGLAYCIAALWFGMRMVMDVGGFCASGGSAYVIQQQCPEGSALLMAPAIPAGFIFGAMMAWGLAGISRGGAMLTLLFWPALFISLGFNFLQGAFDPPGGGGTEAGWLVCGIVFMLMGLPALLVVPAGIRALKPRRGTSLGILIGGSVVGIFLADLVARSVS